MPVRSNNPDGFFTVVGSPIGELLLTGDRERLTGLFMMEAHDYSGQMAGRTEQRSEFRHAGRQLAEYFAGDREAFDLKLEPPGTEFQLSVWAELAQIPYGETRSYGQIAKRIGKPRAARAVGSANDRNPIAVIVPCHRVIGARGDLVGYGGGLQRKTWLLEHESSGAQITGVS